MSANNALILKPPINTSIEEMDEAILIIKKVLNSSNHHNHHNNHRNHL